MLANKFTKFTIAQHRVRFQLVPLHNKSLETPQGRRYLLALLEMCVVSIVDGV